MCKYLCILNNYVCVVICVSIFFNDSYLCVWFCAQIPIFPVLKKDLTFIHLGNDSYIDGLVNFEKLRMTAKEIRNTGKMCFSRYVSSHLC